MADGEITVKLDAETQARLEAFAQAAGQSVAEYVHDLIRLGVGADRFASAHEALDQFDEDGVSFDAETELEAFVERVRIRARAV